MTTCKTCGKETDMPFHTCMTTPTPQTDAQYKEYARRDNNVKCVDIDFARQLEQKLNEAKLWIEKSNTAQYVMQVEAERDKAKEERDELRKVVDELAAVVRGEFGNYNWRVSAYNKLPHVIERKTK